MKKPINPNARSTCLAKVLTQMYAKYRGINWWLHQNNFFFLFLIKAVITRSSFLPNSLFPCERKPFYCNALLQPARKDTNALRQNYYQHRWINLPNMEGHTDHKAGKPNSIWIKPNKQKQVSDSVLWCSTAILVELICLVKSYWSIAPRQLWLGSVTVHWLEPFFFSLIQMPYFFSLTQAAGSHQQMLTLSAPDCNSSS